MISVTFLGVGAALPFPGRTNCCFLIETGETKILFDCGPAVLQQLASVGKTPGDITHLFVSHGHGDHALGYPMFLLWWSLEGREQNLPAPTVIASTRTWAHLRALWEHSYNDAPPFEVVPVELPVAPERGWTNQVTSSITMSTWPMIHSTVSPVLGARFEVEDKVLAFTADTARCENVAPLASGADLLVHDCRYGATVPPERSIQSRFHCSAQDAGEYAAAAGVRNLAARFTLAPSTRIDTTTWSPKRKPGSPATSSLRRPARSSGCEGDMKVLRLLLEKEGIDTSSLRVLFEQDGAASFALRVDGGDAFGIGYVQHGPSLWDRLRTLAPHTGRWPVVLGEEDLPTTRTTWRGNKEEPMIFQPTKEILEKAETIDFPAWLARTHLQHVEWIRRQVAQLESNGYEEDADHFREMLEQEEEFQGLQRLPWPEHCEPTPFITLATRFTHTSAMVGKPVTMALLPCAHGWQTPAVMKFGGWNSCPEPALHMAALRFFQQRYGAELACLTSAGFELAVERAPSTRLEALRLAKMHFHYCGRFAEQGVESIDELAARLLGGEAWYLCWREERF